MRVTALERRDREKPTCPLCGGGRYIKIVIGDDPDPPPCVCGNGPEIHRYVCGEPPEDWRSPLIDA